MGSSIDFFISPKRHSPEELNPYDLTFSAVLERLSWKLIEQHFRYIIFFQIKEWSGLGLEKTQTQTGQKFFI